MKWNKRPLRSLPSERTDYPKGICIKTEAGRFYLHSDGRRYRIQSEEIYRSWSFPLTVETTEKAVAHIPLALTKLGFRDGSLIYNIKDAKMYLVSQQVLRQIASPSVLARLGLGFNDAMVVADKDIKIMKLGEDIT